MTGTAGLLRSYRASYCELLQKATLPKTKALAIATVLLAGVTFSGGLSLCKEKGSEPRLIVDSTQLYPGQFLVIFLEAVGPDDEAFLQTSLPQRNLRAYSYREGFISLVGVDCRTPAGEYTISAQVRGAEPGLWQEKIRFTVEPKTFSSQHLDVTPESLKMRSQEKWQEDVLLIREARSKSFALPLWEGLFLAPLKGRKTADFGLIRFINGKEVGRHSGVDIAAPRGTPVVAANSGIVCLARFLNVTGYTAIVDHGLNLFTSYCHLENLLVKEGQKIVKGQDIGGVGSTGFATGSHLHWGAIIGSIFVDPYRLVEKNPLDIFDRESSR